MQTINTGLKNTYLYTDGKSDKRFAFCVRALAPLNEID